MSGLSPLMAKHWLDDEASCSLAAVGVDLARSIQRVSSVTGDNFYYDNGENRTQVLLVKPGLVGPATNEKAMHGICIALWQIMS